MLLRGVVASLCLTAAVAVYSLLAGEFDDTEAKVLLTTAAISGYGLLASPFPVLLERGRAAGVAYAGLALAGLGFLLALVLIWQDWEESDGDALWRAWIVTTAFAGAFSQAASLLARRRGAHDPVAGVRAVAIGLGFVVAALISIAALEEIEGEGFYRALGAVGVLDVLCLALVPVLTRLRGDGASGAGQFRCTLEDGSAQEVQATGFDDAARRAGGAVRAVERL